MFSASRRAIACLRSLSVFRDPSARHPSLVPQQTRRHFSSSSRSQVQYTRFSDGYTHHSRRPAQDMVVRVLVVSLPAIGVMYYVTHLEQVPETGRWRFMDTSPRTEAMLAKTSYASLLSTFQGKILPPHHPITLNVHRIVSGLLEASDLGILGSADLHKAPTDGDPFWSPRDPHSSPNSSAKEWKLLVVNDPNIVNALVSFDTIVIFTGILPVCKNEAGLAAVVGHEIGHSVARHASENRSFSRILLLLAIVLQAAGIDYGVTRLLNGLLLELPHSRTQELEADTLGMRIAARACYDPRSAVEMHKRLAKASEGGGVGSKIEFLRTHPAPERRIKHLEELVPESYEIRAASYRCGGTREFAEQFLEGDLGGVARWS